MNRLLLAATVLLTLTSQASAQKAEGPPRQAELVKTDKTFSQFVAAGYEVKAMAGFGGIGFVLQKGSSVALCTMKGVQGQKDAVGTEQCMENVR